MRGCLLGVGGLVAGIAVLGLSIFLGLENKSWLVFFLCIGIGGYLIVLLEKAANNFGRINMESWLSSVKSCTYKYAWDGSGIAVDTTNKQVHLTAIFNKLPVSRTYPFSDVREWDYEMAGAMTTTPGRVIGGGIQGATHNIGEALGTGLANAMSISNAMENTGLLRKVRDTSFPQWFIKFKSEKAQDENTKIHLVRWMEILQQNINEDLTKSFRDDHSVTDSTWIGPSPSSRDTRRLLSVLGVIIIGVGIKVAVDHQNEVAIQHRLAVQRQEEEKIEGKRRGREIEILPKAARTIYDYLTTTTRPLPSKQAHLIPGGALDSERTDVLSIPGAGPDDKISSFATFPERIQGKECIKLNINLQGRDYATYVGVYFKCQDSIYSAYDLNRPLSRYQEFAKEFGERHKVMVPSFYP